MNMSQPFTKLCCLFLLVILLYNTAQLQPASKLIAECTITYTVSIEDNDNKPATTKKLFIKGRKTRSEISNSSFYQATIFDNKTGNAVVLKEVGANKYISSLTIDQWKEKNSNWEDVKVAIANETVTIAGYVCRKAILTTKSGNHFTAFYTADYTASASENPYQFKNITGLILEYESQTNEGKLISFKASSVNFNSVPASKFEAPATGYRIIQ